MKVFRFPSVFLCQWNWETSLPRTATDDGHQLPADHSSLSDHQMYVRGVWEAKGAAQQTTLSFPESQGFSAAPAAVG